MGIGDNNYNSSNNSNRVYENTYYSRLKFKNGNAQVNINYSSGLMQIEMGSISDNDGFKFNRDAIIYLSPIKAQMLSCQINKLYEYMEKGSINPGVAFGVNAGMGEKVSYIGFSSDADEKIYMTIGKFDGTGDIIESSRFEFTKNYNFAIKWNDIKSNDLEKVYYDLVELNMLKHALDDFSRSMNGAIGYGVADTARFDAKRNDNKIDKIFDKLGIERIRSNSGNRSYGSNDFLSGATSSNKTSIEDVEDLLD